MCVCVCVCLCVRACWRNFCGQSNVATFSSRTDKATRTIIRETMRLVERRTCIKFKDRNYLHVRGRHLSTYQIVVFTTVGEGYVRKHESFNIKLHQKVYLNLFGIYMYTSICIKYLYITQTV